MRLALQKLDRRVARKTDKMFSAAEEVQRRPEGASLRIACAESALRGRWMDLYVENGGTVQEVCGERVAPLVADPVVAQVADRVFHKRHPELKGRELGLTKRDLKYRSEWMDIYVEFGGRVTAVCEPEGPC